MSDIQTRYEDHAYTFELHALINIDHLYATAHLLGCDPVRPESARILEIGCGAGPDLLAMAERFPDSTFVGMDFAQNAIDTGNQIAREAGLTNIEFIQADLLDWHPPEEKFDYIIAHGFFSWVPDEIKERMFATYSAALSDRGIGYISYLTYPGCKQDEALRDFILMKTATIDALDEKVQCAQDQLRFLERAWSAQSGFPAASFLKQRSQMILKKSAAFIVHDDLGEIRDPCYLVQFVEWAEEHQLQYVGDSQLFSILLENLPKSPAAELAAQNLPQLETEQTMDFITNRTFRSSLVMKQGSSKSQGLNASAFRTLSLSSKLKEGKKGGTGITFSSPQCAKVTLSNRLLIHILRTLARSPSNYIPYPVLLDSYEKKSGQALSVEDLIQLDEELLSLYTHNALKALATPAKGLDELSETPSLSPLNRIYLREFFFLALPDMQTLQIPENLRALCLRLDGSLSLEELKSTKEGAAMGNKLTRELTKLSQIGLLS